MFQGEQGEYNARLLQEKGRDMVFVVIQAKFQRS